MNYSSKPGDLSVIVWLQDLTPALPALPPAGGSAMEPQRHVNLRDNLLGGVQTAAAA